MRMTKEEYKKIVYILEKFGFEKTRDEKESQKLNYKNNNININYDRGKVKIGENNLKDEFDKKHLKEIIFLTNNKEYFNYIEYVIVNPKNNKKERENPFAELERIFNKAEDPLEFHHYKRKRKLLQIKKDYLIFKNKWNENNL